MLEILNSRALTLMDRLDAISKNASYTHDALSHKGIIHNWYRNFNVSHLCSEHDKEAMDFYKKSITKAEAYLEKIAKNF